MPSSKSYARNYTQERKTAKRRGETSVGSQSGDATRHRARRKVAKKTNIRGRDVDHKVSLKRGGGNRSSNLRTLSPRTNRSSGGRSGSRQGKAYGGRKGARKR